jgi:hypothetical protein
MTDTAIMAAAKSAVRDFVTDGVPASGEHDPIKSEVRGVFEIIDAALASLGVNGAITVKKATKALLDADLAHIADVLAVVYNDPTSSLNGIYAKVGGSGSGSWEITPLALPSAFSSDLAEENLEVALALGYGVRNAFALIADRNASSPSVGYTAVTYGEANPANNLKATWNGSAWVDGMLLTQAPFIKERETVTGASGTLPAIYQWNATWDSGSPSDPPVLAGLWVNITTANTAGTKHHNLSSKPFRITMDGVDRLYLDENNNLLLKTAAGTSLGGIRIAGSAGEMGLTSQIDPASAGPADVMRYYWEDAAIGSAEGSAAVLKGMGTNRFSVESLLGAALVHISGNGRFEFEGYGTDRLHWVGYGAGTDDGRTIDFNNSGQTPKADQILSVTTLDQTKELIQFCFDDDANMGSRTQLSIIDGYGRFGFGSGLPVAALDAGIGGMNTTPRTVAQLATDFPSPTSGMRSFVSDANATTFYSAVVGGGSNDVPVFYGDGAWRIG